MFFHPFWTDDTQLIKFFRNLSILGGYLYVTVQGPGKYSVDNWLASRKG